MKLEIPEDIMNSFGLTAEDCLVELGVRLYADRRLPLAQALRLCGLGRREFETQLARRDICLYTTDDFREDVEALRDLDRLRSSSATPRH